MNRYLWVALVVLVWTTGASAGINTSKPLGPLSLYISPDGTGQIILDGDEPFTIDGYTILSEAGLLGYLNGFFDNCLMDMAGSCWCPPFWPPYPALGWTEMSTTPNNYTEVTMDEGATFFPGGCTLNLGQGLLGGSQEDMTFTYVDSALGPGGSFEGRVYPVPEPAMFVAMTFGALVWLRKSRRK